ncbi:MAG: peptide chain release factor N(5)-glutamine methyltransferase, partial [Rudaea sp.]
MPDALTVRQALAQAGLAPVDARALLAHVLRRDRAWLTAHETEPLALTDVERFFALARRRRDGEPVAYLTGEREFWGVTLAVDPSVLIPRPETETLVECALRVLPPERAVRVLDLGTGSGAIAIALAMERPRAQIVATDVSQAAVAIARANLARMKLERVRVIQSSWYEALPSAGARFDLIASNPPYVAV